MTLQQLIATLRDQTNARIAAYNTHTTELNELRGAANPDQAAIDAKRAERAAVEAEIETLKQRLKNAEAELRNDEAIQRLQSEITPARTIGFGESGGEGLQVLDLPDGPAGARSASTPFVRADDGQMAAVERGQRFAGHTVAAREIARSQARDQAVVGQHGTLGQLVRSMTTTGGSAIVPTLWAAEVIDKARNASAVLSAGAQIVPMDAKIVQVGRLTADPSAAFRAEGTAITASDPTFDNVTLTSKTMSALVVGSMEWFADATNADQLVENAIAQAMALRLDLVGLYGGTDVGGNDLTAAVNPSGILAGLTANAATSILGAATNGTTQTAASFFNELLDTLYTPRDYNESPNAIIWNSKLARMYAKAYDTTGQPLAWPADLAAVKRFTSNQVPSYTQGTMTNVATDVFCGDFAQLLIGQRLDVTIQVLTERYADNGQIGILATWRGDVGIARPRAFSVYRALKGSA